MKMHYLNKSPGQPRINDPKIALVKGGFIVADRFFVDSLHSGETHSKSTAFSLVTDLYDICSVQMVITRACVSSFRTNSNSPFGVLSPDARRRLGGQWSTQRTKGDVERIHRHNFGQHHHEPVLS